MHANQILPILTNHSMLRRLIKSLFILLLLSLSYSATLLVPEEYPAIQSAIDAASEGDSVLVSAGTYYENIVWAATNDIKLIGSGEEN